MLHSALVTICSVPSTDVNVTVAMLYGQGVYVPITKAIAARFVLGTKPLFVALGFDYNCISLPHLRQVLPNPLQAPLRLRQFQQVPALSQVPVFSTIWAATQRHHHNEFSEMHSSLTTSSLLRNVPKAVNVINTLALSMAGSVIVGIQCILGLSQLRTRIAR